MNTNTANVRQPPVWAVVLVALLMLPVMQASQAGGGMPWEGALLKISSSLSGPVAQCVCIIAIAGSGFTLFFGGEMNDVIKWILKFTLVASIVLFGVGLVSSLFGTTGAVL